MNMATSFTGMSQLGYAPYQAQNPFMLQANNGISNVVTPVSSGVLYGANPNLLVGSQGIDTFTSSYGMLPQAAAMSGAYIVPSAIPGIQGVPISQSNAELIGSVNGLLSTVTGNLDSWVSGLMAKYQARKAKEAAQAKNAEKNPSADPAAASGNPATKAALADSTSGAPVSEPKPATSDAAEGSATAA